VRCTDTARSFAGCKTKDDYLKAFGIPEGPDKDEMCKLTDGLNPSTSAVHASSNNKIHACLFSLLATLTGLGVTNAAVTETELWRQFAIGASHVMANFHTKESTINGIFQNLPDNTWPTGFAEYVTKLSQMQPSALWCTQNSASTLIPTAQQLLFYGSKLSQAFKDNKTGINNTLNQLWNCLPAITPSGLTNSTKFNWVRKQAWPTEALIVAKASVRQIIGREMLRRKNEGLPTTKFNMNDHADLLATEMGKREYKDTWFPTCWLSFIYYGLPSGDSRACFISGSVALARTNTSLLINRNISGLGKEARRAIDSLQEPTTPVTPKRQKTSPGESTKQVQVTFSTVKSTNSMDSLNAAKMRIDALKMKVDLLQQLGCPQEEIRRANMDLLAALDTLSTLAPSTS